MYGTTVIRAAFLTLTCASFSFPFSPDVTVIQVNDTTVSAGATREVRLSSLSDGFIVRLQGQNDGSTTSPAMMSNLTLSFPQYTAEADVENVTVLSNTTADITAHRFWGCCDAETGTAIGGGDKYADYVLVEGWDNNGWIAGEANSVYVKVVPKAWGAFVIKYRMALCSADWADCLFDPAAGYPASGNTDCLGYATYSITVNVVEECKPPVNGV